MIKKDLIDFNKSLTAETAKILLAVSKISALKNFTLVGGSALSIHLQHRISEDLDFFTWLPELDSNLLDPIIKNLSKVCNIQIINTYAKGIDLLADDIKLTFFANDWVS